MHVSASSDEHHLLLLHDLSEAVHFSVSFSGGPQHYDISQSPLPAYGSWSPTFTASMGWQGRHTNFAASYSRIVYRRRGLGWSLQIEYRYVYCALAICTHLERRISRELREQQGCDPVLFPVHRRGHSIFGTVSVQHQLSERFKMEFGYARLHAEL